MYVFFITDRNAAQKVVNHANYQHHLQKSKSAHTPRSPRDTKVQGKTPFHASMHRFLRAAGHEGRISKGTVHPISVSCVNNGSPLLY